DFSRGSRAFVALPATCGPRAEAIDANCRNLRPPDWAGGRRIVGHARGRRGEWGSAWGRRRRRAPGDLRTPCRGHRRKLSEPSPARLGERAKVLLSRADLTSALVFRVGRAPSSRSRRPADPVPRPSTQIVGIFARPTSAKRERAKRVPGDCPVARSARAKRVAGGLPREGQGGLPREGQGGLPREGQGGRPTPPKN